MHGRDEAFYKKVLAGGCDDGPGRSRFGILDIEEAEARPRKRQRTRGGERGGGKGAGPLGDAVAPGQAEAQGVAVESGSGSSGSNESSGDFEIESELGQLLLAEEAQAQSSHHVDADSVMEPGVASGPVPPEPAPPAQHVAPAAMDTDFVVEVAAAGIEDPLALASSTEESTRPQPRQPRSSGSGGRARGSHNGAAPAELDEASAPGPGPAMADITHLGLGPTRQWGSFKITPKKGEPSEAFRLLAHFTGAMTKRTAKSLLPSLGAQLLTNTWRCDVSDGGAVSPSRSLVNDATCGTTLCFRSRRRIFSG